MLFLSSCVTLKSKCYKLSGAKFTFQTSMVPIPHRHFLLGASFRSSSLASSGWSHSCACTGGCWLSTQGLCWQCKLRCTCAAQFVSSETLSRQVSVLYFRRDAECLFCNKKHGCLLFVRENFSFLLTTTISKDQHTAPTHSLTWVEKDDCSEAPQLCLVHLHVSHFGH